MLKSKKKNDIFIFSDDAETEDGSEEISFLRSFLMASGINRAIFVDLEQISQKIIDNKFAKVVVEEIFLLEKNPRKIPIIFYGLNRDDYLAFVKSCDWYGREDMSWVRNPYKHVKDIRDIIDRVNIRFGP